MKISLCDTFVFLDDVEINKEGYTRRTKIRRNIDVDDVRWLTVPLDKYSHQANINDLNIEEIDWQKSHLTVLRNIYRNTPFFEETIAFVEELFGATADISKLAELNIFLIDKLCKTLQLETRFLKSSDLDIKGKADSYTYMITDSVDADTYLRGKGEAQYSRSTLWADGNIEVRDLDSMQILQKKSELSGHLPGTSILDALFILGLKRTTECLHSFQ